MMTRAFLRWSSPCNNCDECIAGICHADVYDGYMIDHITGEVIDDAATVYDGWNDDAFHTCERCARRYSEECEDGNRHIDFFIMSDTENAVTREYAYDNCCQCDECGEWFERADNMRIIDDRVYCEECAAAASCIGSYHEHKYEYTPVGGTWSDNLIGIEFECDGFYDNNDRENAARAIVDNVNDVVLEEDCSLNCGFEIISQPHTAAALFNGFEFDALTDTLMSWGACECPSTAGMHMHFSRSWFGSDRVEIDETVGRLAIMYSVNWDALVSCSARDDYYQIDNYAARICIDADDTPREVVRYLNSRYYAINNTPSKTVEFRLGAGYVNADYMQKWIRLHINMIDACRRGLMFSVNHDYTITITGSFYEEDAAAA